MKTSAAKIYRRTHLSFFYRERQHLDTYHLKPASVLSKTACKDNNLERTCLKLQEPAQENTLSLHEETFDCYFAIRPESWNKN